MSKRRFKEQPAKRPPSPCGPFTGTGVSTDPAGADRPVWVAIIMLGLAMRFVIATVSWGSNDAVTFWNFSHHIANKGLLAAYRENPEFNHPPIAGLWAAASLKVVAALNDESIYVPGTDVLDVSAMVYFCFVFKLPGILTDVLTCWLVYRIWLDRGGQRKGLYAAAIYAWGLAAMLVSGYHGNSDTIYAGLSLLAAYLLQSRKSPFLAGLALGAAINVKLIPVFLIPAMLAGMKSWRDAARFIGALALCALPFLPLFFLIGPEFYRNALAYKPGPNRWGFMLPFAWPDRHPPTWALDPILMSISEYGRFLLLLLVVAWSIYGARIKRLSLYEVCAGVYAIFLVFATGFGVQYTAVVAPLLCAVSLRMSALYNTLAGIFLLSTYILYLEDSFPFGSWFVGYIPKPAAMIGIAVWATLAVFLVQLLRGNSRTTADGPKDGDLLPITAN